MGTQLATDEARRRDGYFVQSLERGLSVITAFGPERPELTLSEVARATGLTRAAARRFLLSLRDLGYVRSEGRAFRLAPKVLDLGYAYLSSMSLPGIAEPHLESLVEQLHESSSMSVLDGSDIVYVARVPTSRIMTVTINVGTRFPAHVTSMGRVLLAGLDDEGLEEHLRGLQMEAYTPHTETSPDRLRDALRRVREQGYALVDQELEQGLRSLAAPVHDKRGRVVAAVNVSSHVSRVTKEKARREFLPPLLEAVSAIEADWVRI
ncbi:MAG TPA: IclR family transcriptional regulator C-terminal domain-containing protein [Nocardioidaceae bacterium]|nr:IclR family transcriptional regulator C-terminal domain-containing protein [Nocardioidaceae bacterium]